MKKIKFLAVIFTAICSFTHAQNNSSKGTITTTNPINTGSPNGTIGLSAGVEAFRFIPGLVTQLDSGNKFSFETDKQWFSLGKLNVGQPGSQRTLYGFRLQRAGQGLTMGYGGALQTTGVPTAGGNPFIEWIGNAGAVPNAVGSGDLQFFNATGPGGLSGPGIRKLSFTLKSDLTALFGETAVNPNFSSAKVEVNSTNRTGLLVNTTDTQLTSKFINNGGGINFNPITLQATSGTTGTGLDSQAKNASFNIGIKTNATGGFENIGILTTTEDPFSLGNNYGVLSQITGAESKFDVINCGIYSNVTGGNAPILTPGTVSTTGTYAGYFNGLLYYTSSFSPSDSSLKKNIKPEEKILEKLAKINPVTYNYTENKEALNLNLPPELQHGFVAQELAVVYPELVKNLLHPIFDKDNKQIGIKTLKAINYMGLISILTGSMKEMSEKIVKLEEKLVQKEKIIIIDNSKNLSQTEINNITANGYFLGQNNPNPFKNETIIEYSLPVSETNASIMIFNLNGQTLKEYKLIDVKGTISIDSTVLTKGLYLYSLISDGKEIATKKMLMN